MAIKSQIDITQGMVDFIQASLKKELEKEFDYAIERFKQKKGEVVAGILVSIMKTTDMKIMQDRLIFTIRAEEKK